MSHRSRNSYEFTSEMNLKSKVQKRLLERRCKTEAFVESGFWTNSSQDSMNSRMTDDSIKLKPADRQSALSVTR